MRLNELLKNIKPIQIWGDVNTDISGINIDSRKIEPGHLFVAMKGGSGFRCYCHSMRKSS